LIAHLVDGSGVELAIDFEERRVEISAFDEAMQQRYRLTFVRCLSINALFKEWSDGEGDRYNLTDGITELPSTSEGGRRFRIGFVDESVLDIACRKFSMIAIPGDAYPASGPPPARENLSCATTDPCRPNL